MERVLPYRPPAKAMSDVAPAPAPAPSRMFAPGDSPTSPPGPLPAADKGTDAGEEATLAMWCPPIVWDDLEGELAVASPPAPTRVEVPWADRRMADRLPVRRGCRAEVRRWGGGGGGPNIAEELLNVSEVGVGVRLSTPVRRGERFDVTLWGPRAEWCGRGMGVVRWVVVFGGGTVLAGLQLHRPLTAEALEELTADPLPPKSACPPASASRR